MKKIFSLMLSVVLLLLCTVGCQSAQTSSPSSGAQKTEKQIFDERMKALETEYADFIDSVRFPNNDASSSLPRYFKASEAHDQLSMVGIKGVPVLIEKFLEMDGKTEVTPQNPYREGISLGETQVLTMCGILRIDQNTFYGTPEYLDVTTLNCFTARLFNFWNFAEQELSECFGPEERRMMIYQKYGLLSVPYVVKEIENGNEEFEEFFILIGAHITTSEYWKITEQYLVKHEDDRGHTTFEYVTPTEEEIEAKFREAAGDFDYKVWLEENEEDLNFLYEYLDNYCAEYEANNK
jgi:hypothetical protein